MSTLVKYMLALVLQLTGGDLPPETISWNPSVEACATHSLEKLNPHYIITRDELLSLENTAGI